MKDTKVSVRALSAALDRGETTSLALTKKYLNEIKRRDAHIGAFLTVTEAAALAAARAADQRRKAGKVHPLCGIPMALKDNICTKGIATTCASRILENFIPPYDATVWRRLQEAGCVLLGKTNMDEFAMGSSTTRGAFGVVRNPQNTALVAGGSSGGSAAAVAAGEAAFALGSDTGGSVRQPAAFCGVVGLKPTYGRVSRYGLTAFASSLEQVGILALTVEDAGMILSVIAGKDGRDATCWAEQGEDFTPQEGIHGLRVGLLLQGDMDEEIRQNLLHAAQVLKSMGAEVADIAIPDEQDALAAYYVLSAAEASSNLARYDGVRYGRRAENALTPEDVYVLSREEGLGAEVKRRLMLGACALSAGYHEGLYNRAQNVRRQVRQAWLDAFRRVDVVLSPVSPVMPWEISQGMEPVTEYQQDRFTVSQNLTGLPAMSVPFGRAKNGLTLAVQLTAAPFMEKTLCRMGRALEEGDEA